MQGNFPKSKTRKNEKMEAGGEKLGKWENLSRKSNI